MAVSDKQRQYAKKWDKENLKKFTVALKIKQYEKLEEYCKDNNITKAALIRKRLEDIIE